MLLHLLTIFREDNPLVQAFDYNDNIYFEISKKSESMKKVSTKQVYINYLFKFQLYKQN